MYEVGTIYNKKSWWEYLELHQALLEKLLLKVSPIDEFEKYLNSFKESVKIRDRYMPRILNSIWQCLPDELATYKLSGFDALCDLCSEEWALDKE